MMPTTLRPPQAQPLLLGTLLAIGFVLSDAGPARAITHGEPDGADHPSVGALVILVPASATMPARVLPICTGTLISADVYLTAAHCVVVLDGILAAFPGARVAVTFDPVVTPGGTFFTSGAWIAAPRFGHDQADPADISVVILEEVPGVAPARLPPPDLLDDLHARQALLGARFTTVGYGVTRDTRMGAFQALEGNAARNRVEQDASALRPSWLLLAMTPSTGDGGTCYGDSGGPHFVHLDGVETDIVAALTVTGDRWCKATDMTYRTDTPAARAFVSQFVDLP